MTLTELRYIVAVSRELHFGKAAASCFVSQPTLSVAIKKLEEELGIAIFERHQHDITVTPVGRRILEQAQHTLEQSNIIKQIAEEGKDQLKGNLRVGVIYTIGPYLLPKVIPLLNKNAPELTLIIEEGYTSNLAEKLKTGELDIIIVSTPFDMPSVTTSVLYREPFIVALSKDHKLLKKKSIKADDLIEETLLLLRSGNCFRDQVMEACPACKSDSFSKNTIQKTLEGSSIDTIRQMVAAGSGVTILPCTSTSEDMGVNSLLAFRPFTKPAPEREVAIAYRNSYPRKKLIRLLSDVIAACELPDVKVA
jgi:LysR family transcriptional regulator, hydrogen peroxide-inducible genes activator